MSRLTDTRIYLVASTNGGAERLLRAPNKSRAVQMAATARIATQVDLERLLAEGVKVEGSEPRPKQRGQRRTTSNQ
jgi:enoyl-CoA hydratase/carnithine racemase